MLLHSRTRLWLEKKHFPKGPVLLWYPKRIKWLSAEEYKEDILDKLKDSGLNLAVGVGDSEGDIEAYHEADMKAIWLRKPHERHDDEEDDAIVVRSWSAIRESLRK
jgi:phosphoglycolate phosphatase-like HAD superfamily hydrolase